MKTINATKLAVVTAALTLAFAMAAAARGGGPAGGGPARAGFGHGGHARGILGQLVFPCPAACGTAFGTCTEGANDEALDCVANACPTEVAAAQENCAEDRRSEECGDATGDLVDCADACLDTRADQVDVCRDALIECRDACEGDE